MSRRTERVGSTIRRVISRGIATKLSDPRISPFASITRVEVSGDLMHAAIYISVMGDDAEERKTMAGLEHARGFLQSMLARELTIRHCPQLRFVADKGMRKQVETLELLDQISEELRQADASRQSSDDGDAAVETSVDIEGEGDRQDDSSSPGESR